MRSSARAIGLALALAACGGAQHGVGAPMPDAGLRYGDYQDTGLASWYGEELLGNRTASGERFDPQGITAAHRSLPLGSFVEITNIETGRVILARINDRGPGRGDRLIDLSRGAARLLGTDRRAVSRVRVRAIVPTMRDAAALEAGRTVAARDGGAVRVASIHLPIARPTLPSFANGRRYFLQIATFSNEARARALADRLNVDVVERGGLWRVRTRAFADTVSLQRARDATIARGYGDVEILPEDR